MIERRDMLWSKRLLCYKRSHNRKMRTMVTFSYDSGSPMRDSELNIKTFYKAGASPEGKRF